MPNITCCVCNDPDISNGGELYGRRVNAKGKNVRYVRYFCARCYGELVERNIPLMRESVREASARQNGSRAIHDGDERPDIVLVGPMKTSKGPVAQHLREREGFITLSIATVTEEDVRSVVARYPKSLIVAIVADPKKSIKWIRDNEPDSARPDRESYNDIDEIKREVEIVLSVFGEMKRPIVDSTNRMYKDIAADIKALYQEYEKGS